MRFEAGNPILADDYAIEERPPLLPHEKQALRFVCRHLVIGLAASCGFCAAILASDLAGLRGLIMGSQQPWLSLGLLFFGLFITFGSVALGISLMALGRDRNR